jgi:hypothetical protein
MDNVKIHIDLKAGSVSIEAPAETLDAVFDRLEDFLPRINELRADASAGDDDDVATSPEPTEDSSDTTDDTRSSSSPKAPRKRGSATKPETFRAVDLGLKEDQRLAFKEYFEAKKPKGQNQEVLVVMVWLSQNARIEMLSREQLFTGLRTVGARVPTRLSSVLSNLVLNGYVLREGKDFRVHHTAEDLVTHELPTAKNTE